jgi:hypothetical protein
MMYAMYMQVRRKENTKTKKEFEQLTNADCSYRGL